jgi:hypothetical protein
MMKKESLKEITKEIKEDYLRETDSIKDCLKIMRRKGNYRYYLTGI